MLHTAGLLEALGGFDGDDQVYVRNVSGGCVFCGPIIVVCTCELDAMEDVVFGVDPARRSESEWIRAGGRGRSDVPHPTPCLR